MTFITVGLLFDVYMNLHRPFAVKFLNRLGGGEFHVTLLNSLPGLIALFVLIPGSLFINRYQRKKGVIGVFIAISRIFVLLLACVPFLPPGIRPLMFVILLSTMNFPDSISQTGYQGFLGDIFDGFNRSRAITLRNKFGQIVAPLIAIITGLIITLVPRGSEAQMNSQAITIYQIFFVAAFGVAIFEILVFRRFKERDDIEATKKVSLRAIPATLKDKRFVSYMVPTIFFYFMFHSGFPLFGILQVIELQATELHLAINVAYSGLCGFIGAGVWSKLLQKKGNDYVCFVSALGLAFGMILSAFAPNMYVFIAVQTVSGFSGVGIVITLLNGLLAATPEKNRVIYISVYNTFINISLGLSPFFAYAILNATSIRPAMVIIGSLRVVAAFALLVIYLRSRKNLNLGGSAPKPPPL